MPRFVLFLCAALLAVFSTETFTSADTASFQVADPQTWVGTWMGTVTATDSHNTTPTTSTLTIVITAKDIGKAWTVVGNSLSKNESTAGVQSRTTITRTSPDTCSLSADGVGSGRSGFTRHTTGDLKRQ